MSEGLKPDRYPNPLKLDGVLFLARALIVLGLAAILILGQRDALLDDPTPAVFVKVSIGTGLALWGFALLWQAFERLVRVNLLDNGIAAFQDAFGADGLKQLMDENVNPSRRPAVNRLERLLSSLFHRYTHLPTPYRWLATRSISAALQTLVALFLLGGIVFFTRAYDGSQETGIVISWAMVLVFLYLLKIWRSSRPTASGTEDFKAGGLDLRSIILFMILAAVLAVILRLALESGEVNAAFLMRAPALGVWLAVLAFGALLVSAAALIIVAIRARGVSTMMTSSKDQSHWDRMTHPEQIMIAARSYLDDRFGSRTKMVSEAIEMPGTTQHGEGRFAGHIATESAVYLSALPLVRKETVAALAITALGHTLLALSAFLLWRFANAGPPFVGAGTLDNAIAFILTGVFGGHLLRMALWPLSEIPMRSHVLVMDVEGTYAMTKAVAGSSTQDSFRDEVSFHRSNFLIGMKAGSMSSASFALPRSDMTRRHRFILRMEGDTEVIENVKAHIDTHLAKQRRLGGNFNEQDIEGITQITDLNTKIQDRRAHGKELPKAETPPLLKSGDAEKS